MTTFGHSTKPHVLIKIVTSSSPMLQMNANATLKCRSVGQETFIFKPSQVIVLSSSGTSSSQPLRCAKAFHNTLLCVRWSTMPCWPVKRRSRPSNVKHRIVYGLSCLENAVCVLHRALCCTRPSWWSLPFLWMVTLTTLNSFRLFTFFQTHTHVCLAIELIVAPFLKTS